MNTKLITLMLCVIPSVVLTRAIGQTTQPSLNWDLSASNRLAAVDCPVPGPADVWYVEGPRRLSLKLRSGKTYDTPIWSAQVWPKKDRVRVGMLRIMLPAGSLEAVYQDAMRMAKDWGIEDTKEFELFRRTDARRGRRGGTPLYASRNLNMIQSCGIKIRQSFAADRPYHAVLVLGFGEDYDTPTTGPDDARWLSGTKWERQGSVSAGDSDA